jgi:hypothetical protein
MFSGGGNNDEVKKEKYKFLKSFLIGSGIGLVGAALIVSLVAFLSIRRRKRRGLSVFRPESNVYIYSTLSEQVTSTLMASMLGQKN